MGWTTGENKDSIRGHFICLFETTRAFITQVRALARLVILKVIILEAIILGTSILLAIVLSTFDPLLFS